MVGPLVKDLFPANNPTHIIDVILKPMQLYMTKQYIEALQIFTRKGLYVDSKYAGILKSCCIIFVRVCFEWIKNLHKSYRIMRNKGTSIKLFPDYLFYLFILLFTFESVGQLDSILSALLGLI